MPAPSYNHADTRSYDEAAGIRLATAMEAAGADPFTSDQAIKVGATRGLTPRHTLTLLHRVAAGDWLTRVKKGLYAINDPWLG